MEKFILNTKYFILNTLVFVFPFFFLNITQEYFFTNKFYLLGFGILLLILISTIEIIISKKISWRNNSINNLILLFLTSVAISTLFSSPNKIQALLNPNFGLVMMIFLAILFFYVSRNNETMKQWNNLIILSSVFLSLITIVFYFQPFKNIPPGFTPIGSQLDLAIMLGFFVVFGITQIFKKGRPQGIAPTNEQSNNETMKQSMFDYSLLILNFLALFLTIYTILKPNTGLINQAPTLILPPFRLSWLAAIEIIKNPLTAIIGVGPDNFSSVFTRIKDFAYNQSPLWQVNSFNVSHSAILQILTETGIFGLISFGLLIFNVFRVIPAKAGIQTKIFIYLFFYLLICLFVFPPSLIIWFLFFVTLGLVFQQSNNETMKQSIDFANMPAIYFGIAVVSFIFIGVSGYFLGRSYASEYYFKKSIDGMNKNSLKEVYNNQRQAVILNPYIERFRSSFAQTNLIIADNLSSKIKNKQLSAQDHQAITQAIQAGIAEAKAVVSLNTQKAGNWQNLAAIYLNIINAVQGADAWTISAYQRAILADPQNPTYRVKIGEAYYAQKKYSEALKFFEQAISLKPDWANANYNLAWANFQLKNYPQAVNAMQNALSLINKNADKINYEKIQKELEDFKKELELSKLL